MISNIGLPELLVVLVIALLLFGKRLPSVGKSLGEGIKNFKKGLGSADEDEKGDEEVHKKSDPQKVIAQEQKPDSLHAQRPENERVVDVEHRDVNKS